jgi:serine/threonine protein kinase
MYSKTETVIQQTKYLLSTPLGQGTFGITYQAIDTESGQQVVLKTLPESFCLQENFEQFKQQFLVRAQRLVKCQHPNLVRVLDYFEEAGRPYLVMDYIPGQTLADLIPADRPFQLSQAIHYIRQVGAALSTLHQHGLLHRDVRPQNIIRCPGSHKVILSDLNLTWGLALGIRQTQASSLAAGYAPPEQQLPQNHCTPATDVYALAATLYFLLTGHPPLAASIRETLLHKNLATANQYPPENVLRDRRLLLDDLRQHQPNLHPSVAQAILNGLEMVPEQRPQSVSAWLALLPQQTRPKPSQGQSVAVSAKGISASPVSSVQVNRPPNLVATNLKPTQPPIPVKKSWTAGRSLLLTSAIATAAGIGFGLAIRLQSPTEPGSTFLHTEQSFPSRNDWPISDTPDIDPLPTEPTSP